LWSTAGVGVRYISEASGWHIVFFRSISLVLTIFMVMAWRNKGDFVTPLRRTNKLSVLAGLFMGASFFGNIFALLHTSVANVTFVLSSSPFIAALLGWLILGERVKKRTWVAIALTSVGVSVMVGHALSGDGIIGMAFALMMAVCYAAFSVIMRRGKGSDMLPAVVIASFFSMLVAALAIDDFAISWADLGICLALGCFQMGLALVLFISGSKHVPAAELTLLTMLEVILSPIWVWFLFNEHPGNWTLVGGSIIMLGVMVQAIGARRRHPQPQIF
jgi:RarD protein